MSRHIDADTFLKSVKQKAYPQSGTVNESERKISLFGIMEILTAMPTEDVAPVVRGEWLEDSEGEIYCSKCGKYTYDRHDEIKQFNGTTVIAYCYPRFCGNCGADMRGGKDGACY